MGTHPVPTPEATVPTGLTPARSLGAQVPGASQPEGMCRVVSPHPIQDYPPWSPLPYTLFSPASLGPHLSPVASHLGSLLS